MLDTMPQTDPDPAAPTPAVPPFYGMAFDVLPTVAPRRRRRWVLLAVAGVTVLVVVAFAVFAFGVVGASAAGGCGGP